MRYHPHPSFDPNTAELDRATLRRAWTFMRPWRKATYALLATIIASSLLQLAPPLIFKQLIDHSIPQRDLGSVNVLAFLAVVAALLMSALNVASRWIGARIGEGVIYDLRVALYDRVQRLPIAFFTRAQTGALLSRLNADVVGAQGTVSTLANVVSEALVLVSTLVVMVALSWQVTGLALVVLPFYVLLDRRMTPRLKSLSRQRMQIIGTMSATMNERFNVSGAALVKLFGRPDEEVKRFASEAADVRDTGVTQAVLGRLLFTALAVVGAVGTAAVYWYGTRQAIFNKMQPGTIVALAAYVRNLYSPLSNLAGARVDLLTSTVAFDRCFEVLDAPVTVADAEDATTLGPRVRGRVELDDVWFRYPAPSTYAVASLDPEGPPPPTEPSEWVLRGVSFTAEPGTITALVGPSGAGKTTLTSLITRLYDVSAGSVSIDGHDVRSVTLDSLRVATGVVMQDSHMFHSSVTENLRYARPDATLEEIEQACRGARIHDLIASMPDGYDTIVGERGYRLSGGEKQRLAIARVLLKDPAIVVLDEATAHLDSETEALVQQALAAALEGRTAIVIAHRLSTIQAADQILVLDNGRIVERGRHTELVAGGGLYSELYETQSLTA